MAKKNNQKLKLLYLAKIFTEETDADHGISMPKIIEMLSEYDISAERKALYNDIEELRAFGMDIISDHTGNVYSYKLVSRDFEIAELKLLVDTVQSSKFISEKKSKALIDKLEGLASRYEAKQLQRQVLISGRIKTMNESIYYAVDEIHNAINANRQIRFKYVKWNVDKKEELKKDGAWYVTSPWRLRWDDENYYLIAYDSESNDIRHYRVDKMKNISVLDEPRLGQDKLKTFNPAAYSKQLFGMYGGTAEHVVITGDNSMIGVLIDRFGTDINVRKIDPDHFETRVEAAISPQFLGWIASLSPSIKITGPDRVVQRMAEFVSDLSKQYL